MHLKVCEIKNERIDIMKKRIAALVISLIFIFSFIAQADGSISNDTKRELIRYILFTAQSESKEGISSTDVLLETLMSLVETDEEYEQLLRNLSQNLDEYGEYYTPDEINELNADLTSVSGGIGATVEMRNGELNIVNVLPESGAEKAGVKAGWVILEVDGVKMDGMSLYKALSYVRGEIGSQVTIKFLNNEYKEVTLNVTRGRIDIETLAYQMLENTTHKIGYITIDSFSTTTGAELRDALTDLKSQGMERLILDLRNNGGGVLEGALEVADCFLDRGKKIVTIEPNDVKQSQVYYADGKMFDGKMLVLANEYSASASEVVIGALKDHKRAEIMGWQTYGKGTVQTLFNLPVYGGVFKFTTAHYLTPNGTNINKVGIAPHHKVPNEEFQLMDQETPTLKLEKKFKIGDTDDDIKIIKDFLRKLQYDVTEDNLYDEKTFHAVKLFQKNSGLHSYGVCDFTTQKKIREVLLETTFYTDKQIEEAIKLMDK